jgi:hypothetical protein
MSCEWILITSRKQVYVNARFFMRHCYFSLAKVCFLGLEFLFKFVLRNSEHEYKNTCRNNQLPKFY